MASGTAWIVSDPFAWVANVQPFVLQSPSQFQSKGPARLGSRAYAKEYNEVKELGPSRTVLAPPSRTRSPASTPFIPVEMFNRTFRVIAEDRGLSLVEEARLFAMLNMATADG